MEKRVFIGIEPTNEWKKFLEEFALMQNIPVARWVKFNNQHLTVLFLGSTPEVLMPEIEVKIEESVSHTEEFELKLDKFTYKPKPVHAKMLWAQFHKNLEFASLARHILDGCEEVFTSAGKTVEFELHPDIIPHITLARFEPVKNLPYLEIEGLTPPEKFCANNIVLYESVLKKSGSEYTKINEWELKKREE